MSTTATLRYQKQWRIDRARGITRTVPAEPIRTHLHELLRAETSLRGIAEVAGIPVTVVARVANGRQPTVTRRIATALLEVTTADLTRRPNPAGFVPKVGAVRRIRALQAIGHCARDIAAATNLTERDVYLIVNQAGRWITQARWDAVTDAYDRLSMTPGHSAKARAIAAAAGYPQPLAWEEEAIDDPTAGPVEAGEDALTVDEVAVEAAMSGRRPHGLREAERVEVVRRLAQQGWSDQGIGRQLGVCDRTVLRLRQAHRISSGWSA
jgi:hypothetical protein